MSVHSLPSRDERPLLQKWQTVPRSVAKHDRKAAQAKALEEAYEVVNKRDGNVCRVTGEYLQPGAVEAKYRREHHHLVPRSRAKGLVAEPSNIVLVSALAHELLTRGWIDCEGTDASGVLRFHWTALATSHPFKIKSRRRSQQEPD